MMMDNDYELDFGEIIETLRTAEVVTVRFLTISERLLIDNRHSEIDPPLVKLVPRVRSAEERFRSLKELRPRFHLPDKITSISWPKHVHSLVDHGVWSAIVERMVEAGFPRAAQQCEQVFEELLRLEQQEVRNAILGEGYQSLWERNPS